MTGFSPETDEAIRGYPNWKRAFHGERCLEIQQGLPQLHAPPLSRAMPALRRPGQPL